MIKEHIHKMAKTVLRNITIHDVLETINKDYGDITALQIKNADGSWRKLSYVQLGRRAVDVSSTLIKLGIQKNDRVAIYSESRPEWPVALFGIISCAGILVPIDVKLSEKEVQFILNDSQAKFIFVSSHYLPVIDSLASVLPHIKQIILFDDSPRKDITLLNSLKMEEGEAKYLPIYPEDTALIVYTSGTTGVAKGVELSYKNLLFQVIALSEVVQYKQGDQFLSILPLNHMLELTGGLIAPLYAGATITYCESLKVPVLIGLMQETHTTTMISVPLVLKMLHDGVMKEVKKQSAIAQNMFYFLLNISKVLLRFKIRVGRSLFNSIHKKFGGALVGFVSGGAPLDIDIEVNFNALGFRILQGYGLTETAPVISVNTYTANKYGSVGQPLHEVEVQIDKEGEIVTRGPHVMKGYFNNAEKTSEVIKDGWFHTGDIGYLDRDNFLHITGRIRNLIVLGAGKKVFPEEVEEVIGKSPYIKEICVLGKAATQGIRKGCEEVYAIVVPNLDNFKEPERRDQQKIKDRINAEIQHYSKDLAEYKRIKDFAIWTDELPKTATRKIRRKAVADLINR
jgi:long-chain acyl-CoA synthetase